MALTLTEASKLSNDLLVQGVIETIIKDSPVLRRLPFIEIVGNGLTYNQEKTLPDIAFYDVGDTWGESTPTFDQKTANLKIMGGDADVDNFLKTTRSNVQDLQAAIIQQKAKALKNKFEQVFIYGDATANAKEFDGLRKLIDPTTAGAQVIAMAAAGATLTLDKLDELIDAVKGGKPDLLIMSRRTRRKLNSLLRASGSLLETGRDATGNYRLWSLVYGDGLTLPAGTWGNLVEIAASPSGEGFDFRQAFLDKSGGYRCAYVEKFSGSEAYSRVYLTSTVPGAAFDAGLWTEPQPLTINGDYGVSILHSADALWLSSANSVRRASIQSAGTDLTTSVVRVVFDLVETDGTVTLELDNSDGQAPLVTLGDELEISPGFVTDSGAESSGALTFAIDRIERRVGTILVEASDAWVSLKGWKAKNQLRWNASASVTNIRDIIAWLLGRVGLRLSVISSSATITSLCPDFSLNPGADAFSAVRRLLSLVPDVLFIEGGTAYLKNSAVDEVAVYSYGLDHQIIDCRAADASLEINHLRLAGPGGITVEAFDFSSLPAGECYRNVYEGGLNSTVALHDLASTLLREASMLPTACEITVPPNLAQQLYDVVEVTDDGAGLASARYRVKGIGLDYRPSQGKYDMKLKLGGI